MTLFAYSQGLLFQANDKEIKDGVYRERLDNI